MQTTAITTSGISFGRAVSLATRQGVRFGHQEPGADPSIDTLTLDKPVTETEPKITVGQRLKGSLKALKDYALTFSLKSLTGRTLLNDVLMGTVVGVALGALFPPTILATVPSTVAIWVAIGATGSLIDGFAHPRP